MGCLGIFGNQNRRNCSPCAKQTKPPVPIFDANGEHCKDEYGRLRFAGPNAPRLKKGEIAITNPSTKQHPQGWGCEIKNMAELNFSAKKQEEIKNNPYYIAAMKAQPVVEGGTSGTGQFPATTSTTCKSGEKICNCPTPTSTPTSQNEKTVSSSSQTLKTPDGRPYINSRTRMLISIPVPEGKEWVQITKDTHPEPGTSFQQYILQTTSGRVTFFLQDKPNNQETPNQVTPLPEVDPLDPLAKLAEDLRSKLPEI